jgi:hypothetical protein
LPIDAPVTALRTSLLGITTPGSKRYSGFSIGYNVCVAAFGGTTPYVVTWLTAQTANNVAPRTTSPSPRSSRCSPS